MKRDGRRESSNVEDRRGSTGKIAGGLGIGGVIIVGLITLLMGGDLGDVFNNVSSMSGGTEVVQDGSQTEFTAEEQELARFSKVILASTEDVWTAYFQQHGLGQYRNPTLVLYTGSTTTSCGQGQAAMGPFYCSGDEKLYIDLSFFTSMKRQLGADGDFAYAYVIAHEVGHHVQNLLGTLGKAHAQMAQMSQTDANRVSVQIELQADCFAGVWANHEQAMYASLEEGDLQEAITTAEVIGDDYLQKKGQGYVVPESFNHGTSHQRIKWFKRGWNAGKVTAGNTFAVPYDEL